MKTFIVTLIALVFAAGCAGGGTDASNPKPEPVEFHPFTSCTTVTDTAANDDCSAGQVIVTRCTNAIESPDTDHCTGPKANPAQAVGNVWCCANPQ